MRNIINISLPKDMVKFVRQEAKAGKYASISEFIRGLIRDYEERRLLAEFKKGRKEYEEGKTMVLKSLRDLRWKGGNTPDEEI